MFFQNFFEGFLASICTSLRFLVGDWALDITSESIMISIIIFSSCLAVLDRWFNFLRRQRHVELGMQTRRQQCFGDIHSVR